MACGNAPLCQGAIIILCLCRTADGADGNGLGAVISCDAAILDSDAIKFVELLYAYLSAGLPVATACARAKLGLARRAAEMIHLYERQLV